MGDIYKIMDEIRSHVLSLEVIQEELRKKSGYDSEKEQVASYLSELRRSLSALSEIETAVYSDIEKKLKKTKPGINLRTTRTQRFIRKYVNRITAEDPPADPSGVPVADPSDTRSEALITSTVALVDKIKGAISPDLTTMIGRITKIEDDIARLRMLVEALNRRTTSVDRPPSVSLFSRLQDTIELATQITGTVTIRGVPHTIETFVVEDPVREIFTGRFKNLTKDNLVLRIRHLHNDVADVMTGGTLVYGGATLKSYETPRETDKSPAKSTTPSSNITLEEPYRIISLIPTTPASLGLPADKSVAMILEEMTKEVKNKTYTFHTHDPTTYEESDTGNDIVFTFGKRGEPSYLEDAILRLSLEYLDVIYKYLLTKKNSTRGYVAILPTTVFGMKIPTKLFHMKTERGRFINATGKENKEVMKDLVDAYESEDMRKHLPHIAYAHTDGIQFPIYDLTRSSERIFPSNLSRTADTLGQLYVRFARKSSRQPATKIGLQDTITGNAAISDFPNFIVTKDTYSGFSASDSSVTGSEKSKRR